MLARVAVVSAAGSASLRSLLASGLYAGQAVAQVRFPAFEAGGDRWKPRTLHRLGVADAT